MVFLVNRDNNRQLSLRGRLAILLIVMLLPFFCFSIYQAVEINSRLEEEAQAESLELAKRIAISLDDYIISTGEVLIPIANNESVRDQDLPKTKELLERILLKYPYYNSLSFIDANGEKQVVVKHADMGASKTPAAADDSVQDMPFFKRGMVASGISVGDFKFCRITNIPIVHITYPVFDNKEQRVGLVAAAFDLTKLQEKLMSPEIPTYVTIGVIDSNGIVVARNREPKKFIGKDVSKEPIFKNMLGLKQGIDKARTPDGVIRAFGFERASRVPWYVRAGVDTKYIKGQTRAEFLHQLLVFTPFLLLSVLGWFWAGKSVNRVHATTGQLSLTDPLTGLWNQRKLHQDLDYEFSRAKRYNNKLSFMMIDIDFFKRYNDRNGHQAGDEALRQVSDLIRKSVRDADIAYRYGGEEMCVLLSTTDKEGAAYLAERIRRSIEIAHFAGAESQPNGRLTVSIGVATYPDDSTFKDSLVKSADVALYRAKHLGRNRVEVCGETVNTGEPQASDSVSRIHAELTAGTNSDTMTEASRGAALEASVILKGIDLVFFTLDKQYRFTSINDKTEELFGLTREQFVGMSFLEFLPRASGSTLSQQLQSAIAENKAAKIEALFPTLDKRLQVNAYPYDEGVAIFINDVTECKKAEEELDLMTHYDVLTGLPNRILLLDRLNLAVAHAKRYDEKIAVLCVDVDNLKSINATLGYQAGDEILQGIAERIRLRLRESDTIARLNGDEFVLLLRPIENGDDISKLAQQLLDEIKKPFLLCDQNIFVAASVGISLFPSDGDDAQSLIKNADRALCIAKKKGKDTYQFFTPAIEEYETKKSALVNNMRRALEDEQFRVYYQPLVKTNTGEVIGCEALIRWLHPELGLVMPGEFIGLAEENGLIVPMGEWVLRTACRQNKDWQDRGYAPIKVSVNLSTRQFHQDDLVDTVERVLRETGLEPGFLELEITESVFMKDTERAICILKRFQEIGIEVAIDDFGTGYSSLSYLRQFPVKKLKIDRSFIGALETDPGEAAIVMAIIALAHSLNLDTVAEGVETKEQLEILRSLKCGEIQGFLFGKPLPADEFIELLASNKDLCA